VSTVAQRCAEEAAALDREALALVDTQLRNSSRNVSGWPNTRATSRSPTSLCAGCR
jgi:hypothetical protein